MRTESNIVVGAFSKTGFRALIERKAQALSDDLQMLGYKLVTTTRQFPGILRHFVTEQAQLISVATREGVLAEVGKATLTLKEQSIVNSVALKKAVDNELIPLHDELMRIGEILYKLDEISPQIELTEQHDACIHQFMVLHEMAESFLADKMTDYRLVNYEMTYQSSDEWANTGNPKHAYLAESELEWWLDV